MGSAERSAADRNNVKDEKRFYKGVDDVTGFTTRAVLCVPLLVKGKVWGVIQAINPLHAEGFSEQDQEIFVAFANQVGVALENIQLQLRLRGENINLRETLKLRGKIVGQSPKLKQVLATIAAAVAATPPGSTTLHSATCLMTARPVRMNTCCGSTMSPGTTRRGQDGRCGMNSSGAFAAAWNMSNGCWKPGKR